MTFTSPGFLPFLLAVLAASLVFGRRLRWLVLLVASYAFYATWKAPHLLLVLAAVTLSSYACAIGMARNEEPARRRVIFWLGVIFNLGTLIVLKYVGFIADLVNALAIFFGLRPLLSTASRFASIGVSYYVLQALSYLFDVRDGIALPERNLGRYALHVAFFPKLTQGPIERAGNLLPQLHDPPHFAAADVAGGARLFLFGLFQKVVVADRLAPFVDAVYSDIHRHEGVPVLVATYFYAAQVYFDFAGYTDMALGVGRLFGIRLTQNFDSPYLATSVANFWRRWHISFSSWLLEYVFRPIQLGLRDWRTWGTPVALLVTFILSGLWHGPSWGFVTWGLLHGIYLGTSVFYRPWQKKLHESLGVKGSRLVPAFQVLLTFHLVCLAWIFFRASTVNDALYLVRRAASGLPPTLVRIAHGQDLETLLFLGQGHGRFAFVLGLLAVGPALRGFFRRLDAPESQETGALQFAAWRSTWVRPVVYAAMFYLVAFFGAAAQSFVYEQF